MVRDLLTQFLDAYLIRRDLRTTMAFLTDDAVVIGMGVSEVAVNKDEIRTKMLRVFERIPAAHRYEIVEKWTDKIKEKAHNKEVADKKE